MSISPVFKSPFTDLAGCVVSHQWHGHCADMEMKAVDCLEAYGLDRGIEKCQLLIKDFEECAFKQKQKKRVMAMRIERHRQQFAGEKAKKDKYAEVPPLDSF